jgi:methionine-gamma-lyase
MKKLGFTTRQIHADGHHKPEQAHCMPIVQTATFYFKNADEGARFFSGEEKGNIYSRIGNPTVQRVEATVASLEEGVGALAYGAGMAAINSTFLALFDKGDHLVSDPTLYGPTVPLIGTSLKRFGIESTFVDMSHLDQLEAAIRPETKALYFETPSNPTLKVIDIEAVVAIAKKHGLLTIIDNTFATPYCQRPLTMGMDIVIHSATKFLNGHGDVVAGFVVVKDEELLQKLYKYRTSTGAILGPQDAFLILRGLKTLSLRMDRHQENAMKMAEFLVNHPKVNHVFYPGLPDHPGHEIAKKQMDGFSSLMAFDVEGGYEGGKRMMEGVKVATLAVSLGSIDTLIQHPASMTHACMSPDERLAGGITDGLVRLSVGVEDYDDLLWGIEQGLDAI